jgi:hypothetical protein
VEQTFWVLTPTNTEIICWCSYTTQKDESIALRRCWIFLCSCSCALLRWKQIEFSAAVSNVDLLHIQKLELRISSKFRVSMLRLSIEWRKLGIIAIPFGNSVLAGHASRNWNCSLYLGSELTKIKTLSL